MSLSIGIVGLPNVGKSTLFNALLKRSVALVANYPFATIDPNIGVVEVPDNRVDELAKIVHPEKKTYATVKFFDIAGLVKGAHEGEGLGNQFLARIREVDAIVHLIRGFKDENVVVTGSLIPEEDKSTIETELLLADLQTVEKRIVNSRKDRDLLPIFMKVKEALEKGILVSKLDLRLDEKAIVKELNLLSSKPVLYVLNVDESVSAKKYDGFIPICAKMECELSEFSFEDQEQYRGSAVAGGIDTLIRATYDFLDLHTFFTAGLQEVRAWTIKKETKAPVAAGTIHSDFEKGFIKADVVSYDDFIRAGGWKMAREKGVVRLEGKDYVMNGGDVVLFRFNV